MQRRSHPIAVALVATAFLLSACSSGSSSSEPETTDAARSPIQDLRVAAGPIAIEVVGAGIIGLGPVGVSQQAEFRSKPKGVAPPDWAAEW